MIGYAPRLGQNPVLFQQCMNLARECSRICDTITPATVDPATIASLKADCDKCLEYGISEESVQQLGEIKGALLEISQSEGTDWGAIIGGGAAAGVLALLLFGK
jgi:hypothetical protein